MPENTVRLCEETYVLAAGYFYIYIWRGVARPRKMPSLVLLQRAIIADTTCTAQFEQR